MVVTNEHFIQEEIKRRMNSDHSCYHAVQDLLSFCLLSETLKIKLYKNHNFTFGSVSWCLTLRGGGEHTEYVWEQDADKNIWTKDGQSDRRVEKTW
jgi:hypothetical protein